MRESQFSSHFIEIAGGWNNRKLGESTSFGLFTQPEVYTTSWLCKCSQLSLPQFIVISYWFELGVIKKLVVHETGGFEPTLKELAMQDYSLKVHV